METLPYIIVAIGPTGSGKSSVVDKTINTLKLDKKYTKILLDELIENNNEYKRKIRNIIATIIRKCKNTSDIDYKKCETDAYMNPSDELIKQFEEAYMSTKFKKGCVFNFPHNNCNDMNDLNLANAISRRDNIVFETTGKDIPVWLLNAKPFIEKRTYRSDRYYINSLTNKYRIIFAYSIVPFDKLIRRNIKRNISSIEKFKTDTTVHGPRLPNIKRENFKPIVNQIKKNLLQLYTGCIKNKAAKDEIVCGKEDINDLLIFDNSGEDKLVDDPIFNSNTELIDESEFSIIVNRLFGLEDKYAGGENKTKKNRSRLRKIKKRMLKKTSTRARKYLL